jgi:outer membrane protein assembly factor BamC
MQAMKVIKTSWVLTMLISLSACSMLGLDLFGEEGFFRDRQGDYLEAESIPRINVPADKDSYIIDDLLIIPDLISADGDAFLQVPRPRPLQGNPDQSVVIQRMNESSWAVIDSAVSQVWPRIRQYWLEQDIDLSLENAGEGSLDTNWFIQDGNVDTQEKFRVLVEPGFQNESAEVSLIHISVPQDQEVFEQVTWPETSINPEYSDEILNEISIYLANELRNYQASTVSFLAGNVSSEGKAKMLTEDGINMLHLTAGYERSWAAVGRALERAEIEIIEEDVDAGSFSVIFGEESENDDAGIFGRLLSIGSVEETTPFDVFLEESANGIDVLALRVVDINNSYSDDLSEAELDIQEQQDIELINDLIQAIRDFI